MKTKLDAGQAYVTPAARMLSRGGIVITPYRAYVRRLQSLYADGHYRAHASTLNPGLAFVSAATDEHVERLLKAVLEQTAEDDNLAGLESLVLSCLQTVQLTGNPVLALKALALWRQRGKRLATPLVVADRSKNRLIYVPAVYTERALSALSPAALTKKTVGQILSGVQSQLVGESAPHPEDVAEVDCKDNWGAWIKIASTAVGAGVGLAVGLANKDQGGAGRVLSDTLSGAGLGAAADALGEGIATQVCKATESMPQGDALKKAETALADAQAQIKEMEAEGLRQEAVRAEAATVISQVSELGDWNVPDQDGRVASWMNSGDPATPAPVPTSHDDGPPPGGDGPPPSDDDQPRDEDGEPVAAADDAPPPPPDGWATPNPDDSGETHGHPPGIHWPDPGGQMPNPDDSGPGGPIVLPNGAVFIPTSALTMLARATRITVTAVTVSQPDQPLSVFEVSVAAQALGAGASG